jgi:hypothetical protein
MVTLEELSLTYDVLAELMESAPAATGGPTWHVLGAARSVVAAELDRVKDEARPQIDLRLVTWET